MDAAQFKALLLRAARSPRSSRRVVFMGRQNSQFNDNCKYAFLQCARRQPELSCTYLSHSREVAKMLGAADLPVLALNDAKAVDAMLAAGTVVCDDFQWRNDPAMAALLHPARIIQLWHGIPLKAIGMPEVESPVNMTPEKATYLQTMYSGYDTVVSTSPFFTEKAFARAFRAERFIETGYPRNDVLLRNPNRDDMIGVDAELYGRIARMKKEGWKLLVFMPTFRDGGGGPIEDGMLDLPRLHEFGRRHKVLTLLKLHPYVESQLHGRFPETLFLAPASSDAYPLLRLADVLLTDYSSVYFDFLLTGRPIVFYPYDFERYVSRDRALLFDYREMTPGPDVRTPDELFAALEAVLARGEDAYAAARQSLAALAFAHQDAEAAARFGAYVAKRASEEEQEQCKP